MVLGDGNLTAHLRTCAKYINLQTTQLNIFHVYIYIYKGLNHLIQ